MRKISTYLLTAALLCANYMTNAQETIKLSCPFEKGMGREPKEAFTWDPKDEKVIMISNIDTIARSAVTGTVSNVSKAEDGNYEVVIFYKNYYIWYYGVDEPMVKKNNQVKSGQPIAKYKPGNELEFRVFVGEKPVDPRTMLECQILKATD